jgi:hypothetical protein
VIELPPRAVFEPPQYPNVWLHVHERLASSQKDAVAWLTGWLAEHVGLVDDFGRYKPPEASDGQARLAHLQPWTPPAGTDPDLGHAHDLHIRYYHVALRQRGEDRVELAAFGTRGGYYRLAASVHYEVEDEHPRHPYIDECDLCGRTGAYAETADLFSDVHEPLGLELLLSGTVRGQPVSRPDGRPVVPLTALRPRHALEVHRLAPTRPDQNVAALAVVAIGPGAESRR